MLESFPRSTVLPLAGLALLLGAVIVPASASAQLDPRRGWAVVPSVGFGAVHDNSELESGGAEAALDVEYARSGWQWSGYASIRGLGVSCSHACFDGGPALTLGLSRSLGRLWIGGGVGTMKQLSGWEVLSYGRLAFDAGRIRSSLRVEVLGNGLGAYVPIMIGVPISLR